MPCLTAWGQWAVQLPQFTASWPGGGGQWDSCKAWAHRLGGGVILTRRWLVPKEGNTYNALPHCLGAVGSATGAVYYLTVWGQWAVLLLQRTGTLPRCTRQWNSCNEQAH